ncbi:MULTISPECIES: DUF1648 domain-containing protein [unclassified Leucobacter]|uniref:DUF1648 domain-containing protein n=1 Tax=unclassified Leucobacter TaxID=2621730 RepID=UPI00165E3B37|nr:MULTISPECIES: DUF1648 domain-containing protein [unclassified Leucobacter]MBC9936038.1 DUF1648 domain-containing protein [Leucobacter sp. cx-87]
MTDIAQAARAEVASARRVFFCVAIVAPTLIVLAGTAVIIAWLPQLPDPIATHWGSGPRPNGFSSPMAAVWLTLGMGLGMTALFGGIVWLEARQRPDTWGWSQRLMGAMGPAMAVFLTVLFVGMVGMQRGLADAADAGNVDPMLWAGLGSALVVGVIAWFVQPKAEFARPTATGAPIELAPGERAVWIAETRMGTGALVSLGVLVLAFVAIGAVMLASGTEVWWLMLLVSLVIVFGIVTCTVYRVRIDSRGLLVRSLVGWPAFHYTPASITAVAVVDVAPMAEYGGWGLRFIPGSTGVLMRGGEGIQVTLTSGRTFVVTVDDPATGAGLLQAVVHGNAAATDTEPEREGESS